VSDSDAPFVVRADALSRGFGDRWALAGVNLRIRPGGSLLLAGHNGAGKTTLLRILAGLLRPTSGTLTLAGIDPQRDLRGARRKVALVAHQGQHYLDLSAAENLQLVARLLGRPLEDATDALARVGLSDRADDVVRTFSAGMRKRLAFARILLQDPAVVLLDEPWGQLDPSGFRFVDGLLRSLCEEGKAVIVATHLLDRAATLLSHGLLLQGGRPTWVGPATELPAAMQRSES
jgi:heme exporter protein A